MKNIIFGIAIFAIFFSACTNSNRPVASQSEIIDTVKASTQTNGEAIASAASVKEIVSSYLQIKNALVSDNGNDAAAGGKAMVDAMGKFDKSSLSAGQKKAYEDVADDIKENAEHISENSNKIDHQREHFDMLSQDMNDLVKSFGAGQTLYQDFCPMYNNKKGAIWLSETKEIRNPYMGKKMHDCGAVKEELK
ncbi:MAG: DUF3347 domain-containing protein [Chitinophagales bacterium]|nr:DUF3347 domain-containing protein [Chitinophagales bacterium]